MPRYFDLLKAKLAKDNIQLLCMLSGPRTCSHALTIAAGQSRSIAGIVNEPMFCDKHRLPTDRPDSVIRRAVGDGYVYATDRAFFEAGYRASDANFDIACFNIYNYLEKHFKPSGAGPHKIIIHEHTSNMTDYELSQLASIVEKFCVLIRDPGAQSQSLIERLVNDQLSKKPGGTLIDKQQAIALVTNRIVSADIAKLLDLKTIQMKYPKYASAMHLDEVFPAVITDLLTDIADNWLPIIWQSMFEQHAYLQQNHASKICLVDTTQLAHNRSHVMRSISNSLGIEFTEQMAKGWTRFTGLDLYCCITHEQGKDACQDGWNGAARKSTELPDNSRDGSLPKHQLPNELHAAYEIAKSLFDQMCQQPGCIHGDQLVQQIPTASLSFGYQV